MHHETYLLLDIFDSEGVTWFNNQIILHIIHIYWITSKTLININFYFKLGNSQGLAQKAIKIKCQNWCEISHIFASALSSRNRVDSKCERIFIFGQKRSRESSRQLKGHTCSRPVRKALERVKLQTSKVLRSSPGKNIAEMIRNCTKNEKGNDVVM